MSQNLTELKLTLQVMQAETTLEYHDASLLAQNQFERIRSRGVLLEKCLRLVEQIGNEPAACHHTPVELVTKCPWCFERCSNCREIPDPPAPPESRKIPLGA